MVIQKIQQDFRHLKKRGGGIKKYNEITTQADNYIKSEYNKDLQIALQDVDAELTKNIQRINTV